MLRWLGINLRTLLLAFALAIAVWASAVTAADPDETLPFPNPIPIEFVGQDPGLVRSGTVPPQVEVTLRAPHSVWEQLTAQENAVRAVVALSGLGAGTHAVEVQIQISIRPVQLVSVSPSGFDLTLEALATRSMPVEVNLVGELAIGYQAGEAVVDPVSVIVSGPESLVGLVARVQVLLDLSGARQNIEASFLLEVLDEKGQAVSGLTLHPGTVQVSLPVTQQGGYRDLAVKVMPRGRIASGYRLTSISVSPPIVTVFSTDLELINSLPGFVETVPLNLSGASADIEIHLALNLPVGVSLVGEQTVLVQVGIEAIQSSQTFSNRPVEVTGLANGLSAQVSPEKVDVILSGPLPVLGTLLPNDVRVVVDVTGLTAGTYQLTPSVVIVVEGIQVESILPGTVRVVISGTPTQVP